ncbi:vanadium-dependent haloperoxidase [Deinococcus radiodurans]|uniref:Vanadium chloroperoxidase-related protein n=1 Tax=Deinococcus radiodurans (strain ATCC 13939 / DSM 20539 / JCM 16871 / CCUG 27074 / LMG 4051 / NBRC 15346 / NCIMB 9279 / VKM B-1422 / R1) TaxID=243230 RepID=Q9RVL3_DEIRA|nr:vanadium-dependent haloperoxidase [Deinococcus radiodurans]AAF10589.1 vanadium chloroperoxidase-related protein [Deinococcus radiodurans R1 = ATCC 13939 = DSM 20539]UTA50540.1 vanadium-dependent haloperoxidase [Deinococcus radiodurans]
MTPLGLWIEEALRLGEQARLGGSDLAQVLAATAVAGHDAFISCWQGKFEYNVARPQSWMDHVQPGWAPSLPTPPFPSYPSGHATVSGAAAEVLAQFFPLQARQLRRDARDAAFSRVVGGIHWGVDGVAGLDVGQRVARALLEKRP